MFASYIAELERSSYYHILEKESQKKRVDGPSSHTDDRANTIMLLTPETPKLNIFRDTLDIR
jgi:hypothetical protein